MMTGYVALLARTLDLPDVHTETDLAKAVERRLPKRTIRGLERAGVVADEIYAIVGPRRTLARRRDTLSVEESDKAARLGRIIARAIAVQGDPVRAFTWLRRPLRRFEGRTPIELVRTEAGARLVEEMLGQIDHGMAA